MLIVEVRGHVMYGFSIGVTLEVTAQVTKRAIIDVNSIVSGRNYYILTSIFGQLLTPKLLLGHHLQGRTLFDSTLSSSIVSSHPPEFRVCSSSFHGITFNQNGILALAYA